MSGSDSLSACFLLLAVVLAWQLGSLPPESLALMRGTAWAFALCFAAIAVLRLEILLYYSHRFLNRDYIMLDCGGMALREEGFHTSIAIVR